MSTLRIATTDSFGSHVMDALAPVRDQHPDLAIDLLTSNATVDLKKRDADVAVRMFRNEDESLASLKLGSLGWSLYASAQYLAGRSFTGSQLDGHKVIGYVDSLRNGMAGAQWIATHAAAEAIRMQCSGPGAALKVALTGFGVCVVPSYMAAGSPLKRVSDEVVATTDVYAVFLPERRNEPILGAAIDALFEMFDRNYETLRGETKR